MYNKILYSLTIGIIFLLQAIPAFSKDLNPHFQLLPQPQYIEVLEGPELKIHDLTYIVAAGIKMPVLGELLKSLPTKVKAGKKGIRLVLTNRNVPISPEGYTLQVTSRGVMIQARSNEGLFYGCCTLHQLMQDSKECGMNIPLMKITDYPQVSYRAVHFDTKHHLDHLDYYYKLIDKLSSYKINAIIWEIEDKLQFSRHPECSSPNAMSKETMQLLCLYAHERHIDISPLIQGLAHASFFLKRHPELREDATSDWDCCPSNPATYNLQFDLYRDAIEAMPYGKYLHVGGDEVSGIGKDERCKATHLTPFELQMTWLKKVCGFATASHRVPIFWDDMPLKYSGIWELLHTKLSDIEVKEKWNTNKLDKAIDLFPKNCIYMRWFYDDPTGLAHRKVLEWYDHKGLQVMGATAASDGGCPFMPRNSSRALNIQNFSRLVQQNHLAGILATSWDDGSPHWETVVRGFIAQGEFGWNPQGRSIEDFKTAHAQREFGFLNGELQFLDLLEKNAFFFDSALVTSGHRNPAWQVDDFKLLSLPEKTSPGTWSIKYQDVLSKASVESLRADTIRRALTLAKQTALRNVFTLQIYEQNNELFDYPAQLLLALKVYDQTTNEKAKAAALQKVRNVCDNFTVMRNNLKAVYSQTRYMQAPRGYLPDMNYSKHLSAFSLNDDWIFLYEIPFVASVKEWILK